MTKVMRIRADHLVIDPSVQRMQDARRITKIANEWTDEAVGILTVSHRTGPHGSWRGEEEYVIIDGQTRYLALLERKGEDTRESLRCDVYEELTKEEEAALFLMHNDRKAILPRDLFRLSLVAGEPWAVQIHEITYEFGWYLQGDEPGKARAKNMHRFQAIGAVKKVYQAGPETLRRTLHVINTAWGFQPYTVCMETLSGVGTLIARYPEVDDAGLIRRLSKITYERYLATVSDYHRVGGVTSKAQAAYRYTVDLYNKGRRSQQIEI